MSSSYLERLPVELILQILREEAMTTLISPTVTRNQIFTHSAIALSDDRVRKISLEHNVKAPTNAVVISVEEFSRCKETGYSSLLLPDLDRCSLSPTNAADTMILAGPIVLMSYHWLLSRLVEQAGQENRTDILPNLRTLVVDTRINNPEERTYHIRDIESALYWLTEAAKFHVRIYGGQRDLHIHAGRNDWSSSSMKVIDDTAALSQFTWQGSLSGLPGFETAAHRGNPDRTFILDCTEYLLYDGVDMPGAFPDDTSTAILDRVSRVCDILRSGTNGSEALTKLYLTVDIDNETAFQRLKSMEGEMKALAAGSDEESPSSLQLHVGVGHAGLTVPYLLSQDVGETSAQTGTQ